MSELLESYINHFIDKGLGAPENLREPLENWLKLEDDALERWQSHVLEGWTDDDNS